MGSVSNARAVFGLLASGAPAKVNVNGALTIGVAQDQITFEDADIAYSFKMTATGASDDAVWDLEDYGITNNSGTPTFSETSGFDFEGVSMANTATLYALLVTAPATNSGKVYYEEPTGWAGESTAGEAYYSLHVVTGGRAMESSLKNFALTIITSGDELEVTVVGKST